MIIKSIEELHQFLDKKVIGILGFNKDSRNLLKFYKENLCTAKFKVGYLIDLTLDYRPNVKSMAEACFPKNKIITTSESLEKIFQKKQIDALIYFDRYVEDSPKIMSSISQCYTELKDHYDSIKNESTTSEFNFRWRHQVVDYITGTAAQNDIFIIDANPRPSDWITTGDRGEKFISFSRESIMPLGRYDKKFSDAKVRFILGTDWGSGKTTILFNRMKEGSAGVAFDLWFSLVGNTFLPLLSMHDMYIGKGLIATEIYKEWQRDPDKEIFIRLSGKIEEFVYGFPYDRRMFLDNLPAYFNDVKFIIACKPKESLADLKNLLADFKSYYHAENNTSVYRISYNGKEELLTK